MNGSIHVPSSSGRTYIVRDRPVALRRINIALFMLDRLVKERDYEEEGERDFAYITNCGHIGLARFLNSVDQCLIVFYP